MTIKQLESFLFNLLDRPLLAALVFTLVMFAAAACFVEGLFIIFQLMGL
jgi:hypothetical protein